MKINLTGSEKAIPVLGAYVSVKNNTSVTVYASNKQNIDISSENVTPVQPNESAVIQNCDKVVYVQGTGEIAVESSNQLFNFFKPAPVNGGGGGTGDGITLEQLNAALVPYETSASVNSKLEGKVDVQAGYGLSQNSYSDEDKTKLSGLENYDDSGVKASIEAVETKNAEQNAAITANTSAISVLNGTGEGSVQKTVTDEIAKVVAGAPEDFDTLKEMSDWISGHEDSAAAMNSQIQANTSSIAELSTNKANKTEIPITLPANGGNADTVGNYTPEQLIQSNPNLLDNPDFRVNQRGATEYFYPFNNKIKIYTVDRWFMYGFDGMNGDGKTAITDNGVEFTSDSATTENTKPSVFMESFEQDKDSYLSNKTVTMSIKVNSVTGTWQFGQSHSENLFDITEAGIITKTFVYTKQNYNSVRGCVVLTTEPSRKIEIGWIKLELGSVATPFVPPNPAEELLKCMRYYQIINAPIRNCSLIDNNTSIFSFQLLQPMRIIPSVILPKINENTPLVLTANGTYSRGWSVNELSTIGLNDKAAQVALNNSDISKNSVTNTYRAHTYPIALSADL